MLMRRLGRGALPVLLVLFLAGCAAEEPAETGPPPGWEGTAGRWWLPDVDTSLAFRDLETLASMQITEGDVVYAANLAVARQDDLARQQVAVAVKRSLIRLYRNEPELVDSLFERFVMPKIEEVSLAGDIGALVEGLGRQGYRLIGNHFREPRTLLQVGKDIGVAYPDSLRARGIAGSVLTQVYLDEEGVPQAVELIEGVHPVLDDIALRATTRMRWRSAYLLRRGNWRPVPSWARFKVTFKAPPE
jgi:hypothetical protein